MRVLAFIMGLVLGLGIWLWQRYQFHQQLKHILFTLKNQPDLTTSLPILSLLRRETLRLKEQEAKLSRLLQLQKSIWEQAPIGYLEVDEENQLIWCNQQARLLLKIDRWQAGHIRLLLELVRSYELDRLIEITRQSQSPQIVEWIFYPQRHAFEAKSSEGIAYHNSLVLKASSFPLPSQAVGVFIENQQPLVDLAQARERAFSDLTHELRTPLTSIMLVAEALQDRLQNPERHWLEQMLQEARRMMKLIRDWLDVSQLGDSDSQILALHPLDVVDILMAAWERILPLAEQKSVALNYIGPNNLEINGNGDRLLQVFLNIFDNAVRHSPLSSEITLEVSPKAKQVEINIIDWGKGFKPEDLPHVFERLYRGDLSRTRDRSSPESALGGSGLGLSIAQQIIDSHRGSITAKNHPQTQGAWIQIFLPRP